MFFTQFSVEASCVGSGMKQVPELSWRGGVASRCCAQIDPILNASTSAMSSHASARKIVRTRSVFEQRGEAGARLEQQISRPVCDREDLAWTSASTILSRASCRLTESAEATPRTPKVKERAFSIWIPFGRMERHSLVKGLRTRVHRVERRSCRMRPYARAQVKGCARF